MSNVSKIPFLKKFKIYPSKIPKYPEFCKPFSIKVDKAICSELLKVPDDVIEADIKNEFLKVFTTYKLMGHL